MRYRTWTPLRALITLLVGLFAWHLGAGAAPAQVMLITWRGCEEACEGFRQALRERRVDARIVLRDAAQQVDRLPGFLREAREHRVDLIVTWGTSVSLGIAGTVDDTGNPAYNHDIPQVFMIVADPVGVRLVSSLERTGRPHLTGTYNRVPERVNIQTMRAYHPGFRRLGLLYHASEPNSVRKRDELQALSRELDFELVALELPPGDDGRPRAPDIARHVTQLKTARVDFLYLGSSSFLQTHGEQVAQAAIANGLPLLSPYEQLVREAGALMSVAPRYGDVGRLAAGLAERILRDGARAGDLPVAQMTDFAVVIHMGVARRLKRFPALPLLQIAETVN